MMCLPRNLVFLTVSTVQPLMEYYCVIRSSKKSLFSFFILFWMGLIFFSLPKLYEIGRPKSCTAALTSRHLSHGGGCG